MADRLASRSASNLVKMGGICCTTTMGTGKSLGSSGRTSAKAFGPPVEVPIATISMRGLVATRGFEMGCVLGIGKRVSEAIPHSALILGISSARMRSIAAAGLAVLLGLVA